jgi:hypothetical protein
VIEVRVDFGAADTPDTKRMYQSAKVAAAPSAIAMSALMLHVSTPAALQST